MVTKTVTVARLLGKSATAAVPLLPAWDCMSYDCLGFYSVEHCCRYVESVMVSCCTLMTLRSLTVAVYVVLVTIQRYHLFVWTVFSPKLLYESVSSLITSLFVCVMLMSLNCTKLQASVKDNRSS